MGASISLKLAPEDDPAQLASAVATFATESGLGPHAAYVLDLVLEELFTNIRKHAARTEGSTVTISVRREADRLFGTMADDTDPFDPLARASVDTAASVEDRPIGGLGIHLVREMTDSLSYEHREGNNIVSFAIDLKEG